jgi:hypothetical protein
MKEKDERVNLTTECLNNIKMIKLYEWSGVFNSLIKEKRREEMKYLKKNFNIDILWNLTGELYS